MNDAALDSDGDGLTNAPEFRAGTDPQSAASRYRSIAVTRNGSDLTLTLVFVPGNIYRIESKADLTSENWMVLEDQVFAAGTSVQIVDAGAISLPRRF